MSIPSIQPYILLEPVLKNCAICITSPHSGREYASDFLRLTQLPLSELRKLEDCFVDELWQDAPHFGISLLAANFPRALIDVNRHELELDSEMFLSKLPVNDLFDTPRLRAGLGSIPRFAAPAREIYHGKICALDAMKRIENYHRPFHNTLQTLLNRLYVKHRTYLLLDCHSMPDSAAPFTRNGERADIVLGDRFEQSCQPEIMDNVERTFTDSGFTVVRNDPFAGGYITEKYGQKNLGKNAIQIEINRALYMDEQNFCKSPHFEGVKNRLNRVLSKLCDLTLDSYFDHEFKVAAE